MKRLSMLFMLLMFAISTQAVVDVNGDWSKQFNDQTEVQQLTPEMVDMGLEKFLALTPKQYRKMTGKRLGVKKSLQLKAAQKVIKKKMKREADISSGLYVLLAILGLGWVAMGVMSDWSGNDWIVNLILTALCWLPGLIHALAKKKNYY